MRATEIIRTVIDLIDQIDCKQAEQPAHAELEISVPAQDPATAPADANHFKQIFDLISTERNTQYSNSPAEVVAGIDSVTSNAGGGEHAPKNPADIKSNSISMYPNWQAKKDGS